MASRTSEEKAKKLLVLEAASSGNIHVFKELAEELDIKAIKDANGLSAFHLGAFHGRTNICQYFVEDLGFHVDFLSPKGETPLFHAAMGGHVATARYLINHGANPVAPDEEGLTSLHCAARYGQGPLLKFLLSLGVPVDIKVKYAAGTPLTVAAIYGQASSMKILLEHHADVNCTITNDCAPLFLSVSAGSLLCTKLLIKAGADLNFKCPLARAIPRGAIEIIKCLLEAGADPNVHNEYGWLPIEIALMCRKWDIVEILFPLTSPVPEVHDWSVQGIFKYAQSNAFKKKNKDISEKNLADLKAKGADSFRNKDYPAAIYFYSEAIGLDSLVGLGDAALFSNRSLCLHRIRAGQMALNDALIAHRLRPDWPKAHYRLGAAFMLLEDYEQASRAFKDSLLLDPTNVEMKKAYREALDCLKKSRFGEESK